MVPGLKHSCYKVTRSPWQLFQGNASATLTLTGSAPTVPFRIEASVLSISGHTDCAGKVLDGGVALAPDFAASGQKRTGVNSHTTLPVVTTQGLDCQVTINAIDQQGAPIYQESVSAAIRCRWLAKQKSFQDSEGLWQISAAEVLTQDTSLNANDTVRYGGADYVVGMVDPKAKLSGVEFLRRLVVRR